MTQIMDYLENEKLPYNSKKAKKLRRRAT